MTQNGLDARKLTVKAEDEKLHRLLLGWRTGIRDATARRQIALGILRNMPRNLLSKQETSSWFQKQSNDIHHNIKKADSSISLYENRLFCFIDLQY